MTVVADHVGKGRCQPSRATAALQHPHTRTNPHRNQDLTDFLGVHDLSGALDVLDQVRDPRLQQVEGIALVRLKPAAPFLTNNVVVFDHASVGLKHTACHQAQQMAFMTGALQLNQVPFAGKIT